MHGLKTTIQLLYKKKFMFIMKTPTLTDTVSKFITNAMTDREVFLEVASSLQLIVEKITK